MQAIVQLVQVQEKQKNAVAAKFQSFTFPVFSVLKRNSRFLNVKG